MDATAENDTLIPSAPEGDGKPPALGEASQLRQSLLASVRASLAGGASQSDVRAVLGEIIRVVGGFDTGGGAAEGRPGGGTGGRSDSLPMDSSAATCHPLITAAVTSFNQPKPLGEGEDIEITEVEEKTADDLGDGMETNIAGVEEQTSDDLDTSKMRMPMENSVQRSDEGTFVQIDGESSDHTQENNRQSGESGPNAHDSEAEYDNTGTAAGEWAKERNCPSSDGVGAVQVEAQAPQLNRRFFRGLDRASAVARRRNRRARERAQESGDRDDEGGGAVVEGSGRRGQASQQGRGRPSGIGRIRQTMMALVAHVSAREPLVTATLVEDIEGEVVTAERVGYFDRKGKLLAGVICMLVAIMAAILDAFLTTQPWGDGTINDIAYTPVPSGSPSDAPSLRPSAVPSSPPSYDPRPTLEIVQSRGHVRCGVRLTTFDSREGMYFELCRSFAAVLLGDPDSIELVQVTGADRFQQLNDRVFDILLFGDTHTIEREIREKTTRVGFTFSSIYYYDGMAYFGNDTYVSCAEDQRRYKTCSSLRICVVQGTTSYELVKSSFPPDFFEVVASDLVSSELLWIGTCNVIASDRSKLFLFESSDENIERKYVVGDKMMTKDPLAAVTRRDDYEFSDIIDWVINTIFYGEEQGLTKDSLLCHKDTRSSAVRAELDFLNAIYCVGNYEEIFAAYGDSRGMNQINNGTSGMLYAIPFGNLDADYEHSSGEAIFGDIKKERSLTCGVAVPGGFNGNITSSDGIVGLGADYCRTLAAALFNGDYESVTIIPLGIEDGFVALDNGTIDVLAGGSSQWKVQFENSSPVEFHFSTPYYYGNEYSEDDLNIFTFISRKEDVQFSSFVECMVLSTIYAQENRITKDNSKEMPLIYFFGTDFNWALRDAIAYSGSYDDMYLRQFGTVSKEGRGRNALNTEAGPQIHSYPGFDAVIAK